MKNYYYVVSINMTNERIQSMLERTGLAAMMDTMIDFKLRSRLFMSYKDALTAANGDFEKKCPGVYPGVEDPNYFSLSVPNPELVSQPNNLMAAIAAQLNTTNNNWDPHCCNVLFFTDEPIIDEDEETAQLSINSWMFKYEIYYTEDAIELAGNGDYVFSQMNLPKTQFSSTYQ